MEISLRYHLRARTDSNRLIKRCWSIVLVGEMRQILLFFCFLFFFFFQGVDMAVCFVFVWDNCSCAKQKQRYSDALNNIRKNV